jgi:hypothetical protein
VTPDVKGIGMAAIEDRLDTDFAGTPVRKGTCICFTMRMDSRSVSAFAVKRSGQGGGEGRSSPGEDAKTSLGAAEGRKRFYLRFAPRLAA